MSSDIQHIQSINIYSARAKKTYTVGELFEYKDAKGKVTDTTRIVNITEYTKQIATYEAKLVYRLTDQHGNLIDEICASVPGLEIICKPI